MYIFKYEERNPKHVTDAEIEKFAKDWNEIFV